MEIIIAITIPVMVIELVIIYILANKIHENDDYMNKQEKDIRYLKNENLNLIEVIKEDDKEIRQLRKKVNNGK